MSVRVRGQVRQVVAVEGDVHDAHGQPGTLHALDGVRQHARDGLAAPPDAHQHHAVHALVALNDLVRHARDRAPHLGLVHQLGLLLHGDAPSGID